MVVNPCPGLSLCSDGTCQDFCTGLSASAPAAERPRAPPVVTLLGSASISFPAGTQYDACPSGAPLAAICDRGASAASAADGNLSPAVASCAGDRTNPAASEVFAKHGLAGCFYSLSLLAAAAGSSDAAANPNPPAVTSTGIWQTPGVYNITFSAVDTHGAVGTAVRTVRVAAACAAGESTCLDQVTCSSGGLCSSDIGAQQAAPRPPPAIQLAAASDAAAAVSIDLKQFSDYSACLPGAAAACGLGLGFRPVQLRACPRWLAAEARSPRLRPRRCSPACPPTCPRAPRCPPALAPAPRPCDRPARLALPREARSARAEPRPRARAGRRRAGHQ